MKIVKIEKCANNKYKIILENKTIITYDNVILKYNLLYKNDLNDNDITKIENDTTFYEVYNKALKYCTNRIRCESEVKKYIEKFNISNKEQEKIVKKLVSINLINDKKYCEAFINDKIYLRKQGIKKVEMQLKKYNIDDKIISEEISKIDKNKIDLVLKSKIEKKVLSNSKYSNWELKTRLITRYVNEGYDREVVLEYINEYLRDDSSILVKEFNKLNKKYEKKYNKKELYIKIRQKLIQKGFCLDSINDLIKKNTEE